MSRIPIRIYKLLDPLSTENKEITIPVSKDRYIQNKTTSDIILTSGLASFDAGGSGKEYGSIELSSSDFSDFTQNSLYDSFLKTYRVYVISGENDSMDIYYVWYSGHKYYFKDSEISNGTPITSSNEVFEFYVNPERITPTYRKLITETRTRGGWDVQHWGEQLTEIRVEGRTGGLIKQESQITSATSDLNTTVRTFDITQSVAWKRLNQLKKLYDEDHKSIDREGFVTKLGFNFYDKFYVGYFSDFSGPNADAEKPYIMNYSFTFKVEAGGEYQMDSSLDSLKTQQEILGAQ
jgi:hypothetical protein